MVGYIKDFKTFETVKKFDCENFNLVEGGNGSVVFHDADAFDIMKRYSGAWCVILGKVFFIAQVTPDDKKVTLTLKHPLYAFDREIPYTEEHDTYGELIAAYIASDYINGGGDNEYKMPYLSVNNTDHTPYTIEVDENTNYFSLAQVMAEALANDVVIDFEITGHRSESLSVVIRTAENEEARVLFNDGHAHLEKESYKSDVVAKVTVIQTNEDESKTTFNYYLSKDGEMMDIEPSQRASGRWVTEFISKDESPTQTAREAFSLIDSHKIEFYSDKDYRFNQTLIIKLRGDLIRTRVTYKSLSMGNSRYYYKCGTLPTTLIDKIKELEESK